MFSFAAACRKHVLSTEPALCFFLSPPTLAAFCSAAGTATQPCVTFNKLAASAQRSRRRVPWFTCRGTPGACGEYQPKINRFLFPIKGQKLPTTIFFSFLLWTKLPAGICSMSACDGWHSSWYMEFFLVPAASRCNTRFESFTKLIRVRHEPQSVAVCHSRANFAGVTARSYRMTQLLTHTYSKHTSMITTRSIEWRQATVANKLIALPLF